MVVEARYRRDHVAAMLDGTRPMEASTRRRSAATPATVGQGAGHPAMARSIVTRPLRYSINVTLDGCVDHTAAEPDEAVHRHAMEYIAGADAVLFGRTTYEMMEAAWRGPDAAADLPPWTAPFARAMDAARKYVVSSTLPDVDWNAELVRGDLASAVRRLKAEPGRGLATGGVMLPTALAELGLIDEYQFVVHPRVAGRGPRLLDGLSRPLDLELVDRLTVTPGVVASRYVPRT
jgi:dihydrofolate reductase